MVDSVKTYKQIHKTDQSLNFGISRMEEIFDKRHGQSDTAHRHDFYTILFTITAKGKHLIDFREYDLADNQIFFISPGQVHQVIEDKRSVGYSLIFSNNFLIQNNIPISFIENINLFKEFGHSPPLNLKPNELTQLKKYAEEILEIGKSNISLKNEAIGALLNLLLIRCNNYCSEAGNDTELVDNGHNSLLSAFKQLVNDKHTQWHHTSDYAKELNVTPDHLNRVVKALTGKTAKENIQNSIITAAKRMIYFTDLSNKEIGYSLGFMEPAHFSAFFKNCTGHSPSNFLKEQHVR